MAILKRGNLIELIELIELMAASAKKFLSFFFENSLNITPSRNYVTQQLVCFIL